MGPMFEHVVRENAEIVRLRRPEISLEDIRTLRAIGRLLAICLYEGSDSAVRYIRKSNRKISVVEALFRENMLILEEFNDMYSENSFENTFVDGDEIIELLNHIQAAVNEDQ